MAEETENRYCRVCDRQLVIIQEKHEDDSHIPLFYCEECNKHYRFVVVD
jgi:hypothetical protein